MGKFALALSLACACFLSLISERAYALTLPHELPWTNDGITYTDVFAAHATDFGGAYYYHYYNNPQNMSAKRAYDWGVVYGNGLNDGYDLFQINCDANNSNCTTAYFRTGGSSVGQPICWTHEYLLTTQPLLWMNSYSGLCGVGDVVQGTYFPSAGINDGLVGYWKFDDPGNLGLDSSGFGNHGTPAQGYVSYLAQGIKSSAVRFTAGSNSGITIPNTNSLNFTTGITVTAWINLDINAGPSVLSQE